MQADTQYIFLVVTMNLNSVGRFFVFLKNWSDKKDFFEVFDAPRFCVCRKLIFSCLWGPTHDLRHRWLTLGLERGVFLLFLIHMYMCMLHTCTCYIHIHATYMYM